MIDRHLHAKKKHSLDIEGVFNPSPFLSPTWLPHGQLWILLIGQQFFAFYEIFSYRLPGLETFYIDIKTITRVKKQTMFQRKMADFKGK